MDFLIFIFGLFAGIMFFEPLIINVVYFTNLDLFNDIILTKKNSTKLKEYYYKKILEDEKKRLKI